MAAVTFSTTLSTATVTGGVFSPNFLTSTAEDNGFLGITADRDIWFDRTTDSLDDTVAGDYYILEIDASVATGTLETFDITLDFDHTLFETVDTSNFEISDSFGFFNQVSYVDGQARLTAGSSAELGGGSGIGSSSSETFRVLLQAKNDVLEREDENGNALYDGDSTFNDAGVSTDFTVTANSFDSIVTSGEGSSFTTLNATGSQTDTYTLGEKVSELGFTAGDIEFDTNRTTGVDATTTKLIRQGDTVFSDSSVGAAITIGNSGNAEATSLEYSVTSYQDGVDVKIDSGSGSLDFDTYSANSLTSANAATSLAVDATEDVKLVMSVASDLAAGTIIDTSAFSINVKDNLNADTETTNFISDKSLVTYASDLNYDGRVSMIDLAYLNSGAGDGNYARDVDVNFDGEINIYDLARMDDQFGKSIHYLDDMGSDNIFAGYSTDEITLDPTDDKPFIDQNAMEHGDSGIDFMIDSTLLTDSFNTNNDFNETVFNDGVTDS